MHVVCGRTTMIPASERERAFREDLNALLLKHRAELQITDDGAPWGLHCAIAVVTMEALWDDQDIAAEFTTFQL